MRADGPRQMERGTIEMQRRASWGATIGFATALIAFSPVPIAAQQTIDGFHVRTVSLDDLGEESGLSMQGTRGFQTMIVPIPRNSDVVDGLVTVDFDAVMPDYDRANISLIVNGTPVFAQSLEEQEFGTRLTHYLTPVDLEEEEVRVDVQMSATLTDNRCYDDRVALGNVLIRPETNVAFAIRPESINGVTAALELLPKQVLIGVEAGPVISDAFVGAMMTAIDLRRRGHEVEFVTLPDAGNILRLGALLDPESPSFDEAMLPHIIVARSTTIGSFAQYQFPDPVVNEDLDQPNRVTTTDDWTAVNQTAVQTASEAASLVTLMRFGARPMIAMPDVNAPLVARHLAGEYDKVALGPAVVPRVSEPRILDRSINRVSFEELGFTEANNNIVTASDYFFPFRLVDLPPGQVPSRLNLDIVSPPALGDQDTLVYVYYNESLLGVTQLDRVSSVQQISVDLPQRLHRAFNQIRLTVQREELTTPCESLPRSFPTRVLTSSSIQTTQVVSPPTNFAELTSSFDGNTEIYLMEEFLATPAAALSLSSTLLVDVLRDQLPGDFRFYTETSQFLPDDNFILIGDAEEQNIQAPVQLERGRVILRDEEGETVLDVLDSVNTAVAQVAGSEGHFGLWIAPTYRSFPNPEEITLDRGDIAFIDRRGTFLELSSETDTVVEITYPEEETFADIFAQYRYFVLAAIGIIALLIFITVFQSVRRSWRSTQEAARDQSNNGGGS